MRPINVTGFVGSSSATDPKQLPETMGVRMENAYPGLGDLRPLKQHLTVATVPTSPQRNTIWRMGRGAVNDAQYWLAWSAIVSVTLGFGTDTTERTFYTGDGTPKWTNNSIGLSGGPPYPQASRELSVPAPTTAPTVALDVDGTGTEALRYYVQTFVNDLGWESAPSPPSTGLLCKPGATVDITALGAPPGGSYGFATRRIYRTQPEAQGTSAEFYFLREIPIGDTVTEDDARELGDLLATEGWLPPPATAFGIIALWNSIMAMLDGREVLFSEAGVPYAYPLRYRREVKDTPLATAKWGQNLLVLTVGTPVVFQGQDPAGMQDTPLRLSQALLSVRGVVSFGHGVAWPSNEGLAYCGDSGQSLLTEGMLTPAQWKALVPSTMIAGRWDRFYVCSYDDGSGRKGFMLDPLNPKAGLVWLTTGFDACHYDDLADQLYVLEGGNVRKFAGGAANMTASFTSKEFLQTHPVTYGAAKVVASSYPLTLEVYANGALKLTRSVPNGLGFKLPDGFTAERWQVKITTTVDRTVIARLAKGLQDLKGI